MAHWYCRCTIILLTLLFVSSLYSGTTGKISGTITDEKTGEPIAGATVLIAGTKTGAASDIGGMYVIANVGPGTYTLNISSVGYRKYIFEGVQVNTDFTTRIDVKLSSEAVNLEAVVVHAERPLVRTDLTSSQVSVDASQIKALPVENVTAILSTQAGVIADAGGALHFRGGRADEVSYTVNGVSINNPFTNTNSITIATNAIQELSVVQGTFNAEYGNALSGVVETGLKEGGETYNGQITFYTGDRVSSHNNIFLNVDKIDPLSNYITEGSVGGPIPLTNGSVTFFASARSEIDRGWLYGVREHSVWDRPDFTNDTNWIVPMTGDGALVPMNPDNSISASNRVTFNLSSTRKLSYDFVFNQDRYRGYNHAFKYNPDGTYNNYENDVFHTIEYTDWFDTKTYIKIRGSYSRYDYEQYRYKDMDSIHYAPTEDLQTGMSGGGFYLGGTLNGRFEQTAEMYQMKGDIVSELSARNEMKAGVEAVFPQMRQFSGTVLRDLVTNLHPVYPQVNDSRINSYARFPKQYAGYLQDKMEYQNIVLNLGLRYDYFKANAKYPANIFYPRGAQVDALAKQTLSPRIGISYPITDRGIIHFSYGHFYQMPQLRRLYENPNFKFGVDVTSTTFGNANLDPQKTVTYEFGLQQQLTDNLVMNVTGFYKDVRDLFAVQTIRISGDTTFNMYVNQDYGNIKGITFRLEKRRLASDLLSLTIDYTFQVAEGNDVSADAFFIDQSSGRESEKVVVFLDWDQTHTLNTTLTLGKSQNWNVSVIGKVGAGLPYTPFVADNQVVLKRNSARKPMQSTVDLVAEKHFQFAGLTYTVFLKVYNLFDTLNEVLVYDDTGRATYTLAPSRGEGANVDAHVGVVPGIHGTSDYFNNPAYYSPPREVQVGASITF